MPNNRPIPKVETKHYATSGAIMCQPGRDEISIEVHHCTAFLSQIETLQVILSMVQASHTTWGLEFVERLQHEMGLIEHGALPLMVHD